MARRGPSKAAQRKGGRAAARSHKSPIGRKGSSTDTSRKRSTGSTKFIAKAIKRPGALTRRAKSGTKRSVHAQARHDMKHGTTLQKRQASFYLNVLKPAAAKRKKR